MALCYFKAALPLAFLLTMNVIQCQECHQLSWYKRIV